MIWRALAFLAFLSSHVVAQNFTRYQATTLDAVFEQWNDVTRNDGPGVSIREPQKVRFVATLRSFPAPCSNSSLAIVLRMLNLGDILQQIKVTNCLELASPKGRNVVAYVQDVLVPGLKSDAKVGGSVEIYAESLAYTVEEDRSRNHPILLVSRFEPQ
jgi:hypothetical protein